MSKSKIFQAEVAYDAYVAWIAEHIPGMLEVIGGGPLGPGGVKVLAAVAKASTPAQRERMLKGLAVMANFAEKGKKVIAEAGS
jgi:hypothetical protein